VPGAAALLSSLPPERWALVTSASRELANNRMQAAGLPLPTVMVCAGDVQNGKPAPDGYIIAAAELGIDIADCLVLEDAAAGIRAGNASGAKVIAVVPEASAASEAFAAVRLSDMIVERTGEGFNVSGF